MTTTVASWHHMTVACNRMFNAGNSMNVVDSSMTMVGNSMSMAAHITRRFEEGSILHALLRCYSYIEACNGATRSVPFWPAAFSCPPFMAEPIATRLAIPPPSHTHTRSYQSWPLHGPGWPHHASIRRGRMSQTHKKKTHLDGIFDGFLTQRQTQNGHVQRVRALNQSNSRANLLTHTPWMWP